MNKVLVAYFRASGITKNVATKLANVTNASIFEIKPEEPYTDADLDWMDKNSRSSIEMRNKSSRPKISNKVENIEDFDVIFLGFPIWWYVAPTIINSFLESYNLDGKIIVPFATSGSSGMGNTVNELKPSAKNATIIEGKRFASSVLEEELKEWVNSLNI